MIERKQSINNGGNKSSEITHPRWLELGELFNVELLPATPYDVTYTTSQPSLGFAFDTQVGEHSFSSDRKKKFIRRPNSLSWLPQGCEVSSLSPAGGEYLVIGINEDSDNARFNEKLPDSICNNLILSNTISLAKSLRKLMLRSDIPSLEAEEYVYQLSSISIDYLLGKQHSTPKGWLTSERLKKIDELIDASIEAELTISYLSDYLGVSAGFFIRAFKAGSGTTPHRYVMDRRILKARDMLIKSNQDIAEISYACGFSSQSHMTTAFNNSLGITPALFR